MFFTYILESSDSTYYTGSTNNLKKRLYQHNNTKSGAHYTKIRRPVTLKYSESCGTYSEARKRECEIKKLSRSQKIRIMTSK